jgi:1-acyl-sn-glycerol-3-phosphate acyltransferase
VTAAPPPPPGEDPGVERLARWLRRLSTPLYRTFLRVRVEGRQHIPNTGGVILAPNHISFFDSVALIQSVPRRTFFLGKEEYMRSALTARLFPAMGMIPIPRERARQAVAALELAADVVRRGHPLAIYPEGTRSRDGRLHRGHTGVAQLSLMSGAPIVPVGLVGTDRIQPVGAKVPRPFRHAAVRFGEPLDPGDYGGSPRRRRQLLTNDLMEAIRRLSGQEVSRDFASDEPPIVRGGTESVYRVDTVGGFGASWAQAARFAVATACGQFSDGRVGEIRKLSCALEADGAVRFLADVAVSIKLPAPPPLAAVREGGSRAQ